MAPSTLNIFGGEKGWHQKDWTSSDDRVRGGQSQSYLDCSQSTTAIFYGNLDIDTLGGAGFASQRTKTEDYHWDLSDYDGILLEIVHADTKRYTFNVKDAVLPKNPADGREQSSISWEYDFSLGDAFNGTSRTVQIHIPWDELKPTYRGKERKDAEPLKLGDIRRFSIMMRSFFGDQQGPFTLTLKSVSAYKRSDEDHTTQRFPYPYTDSADQTIINEKVEDDEQPKPQSMLGWLFEACTNCVRLK